MPINMVNKGLTMSWLTNLFTTEKPIKVEHIYVNGVEVEKIFQDEKEVWNNKIKQRKTIWHQQKIQ